MCFTQKCSESSLDSLKKITQNYEIANVEKVDAYLQISSCYLKINIDTAIIYTQKAKEIAASINYSKGIAQSFIREGQIKNIQGRNEDAKDLFSKAIALYKNIDKDRDYLIAYNISGFLYEMQQNYDIALEYYLLGLKTAISLEDELMMAYFYNNISIVYASTGMQKEGFEYILKASKMFERINHREYYSNTLINIGNFYQMQEQYDSAKIYFIKATKLQNELNNFYGLMNINNNLGDIARINNSYHEALDYYLIAMEYTLKLDSLHPEKYNSLAIAYQDLGHAYLLLNDYSRALEYFRLTLASGHKLNSLFLLKESYYGIYSCFEKSNLIDSALYYHKLLSSINDSLQAELYNDKIKQLNFDFKLEEENEILNKEKELIIIQKHRQELIYIVLLAVLFIIALIGYIIWYMQKNKFQKSELKGQNLNLEKEKLTLELDHKNKELTAKVLNLIERNEFIATLSARLYNQTNLKDAHNSEKIEDIVRSIDKGFVNNLWKEFELRFMEVHNDFHHKLTSSYPKLTANDRKLCAFIILNMSTKDISSITYQSQHSIRIARYRLRKKLGLKKNENLTFFLHNL